MAADFTIRQGDTSPVLAQTILDAAGAPLNLTGASVTFVMRALTAQAATTNATATIVTPSAGTVTYTFTATDTASSGIYMAEFHVTLSGGALYTFPNDGYLEISIEENLVTPGGNRLMSLGEAKDYLNIPTADRSRDAKLMRFLDQIGPVIEFLTGPIRQRLIQNETYDGQGPFISLRNRPVISIQSVTEYRGPIPYPLTQVPTPDLGTIYSYMFEAPGRIVRRTVGGGMTSFPSGMDSVFVSYTAGFATVPANVTGAVAELLRVHFQTTQQGRPRAGGGGAASEDVEPGREIMGFFVPNKVREMLQPNRRHSSIA